MIRPPPRSPRTYPLFPYTPRFRSLLLLERNGKAVQHPAQTVVLDLLSHHLSRRPPKAHRLDFFDAVDLALHNIVGERNGTQEARKKSSKPIGKAHAID